MATMYSNILSKYLLNTCCVLSTLLGSTDKILQHRHHPNIPVRMVASQALYKH